VWKRCVTIPEMETTADMLNSGAEFVGCAGRRLEATLAGLPVPYRWVHGPTAISAVAEQLAFDVCWVGDVLSNSDGESWYGGNVGHIMSLGCRGDVLTRLLYFHALRAKGDDAAFAEHLQIMRSDTDKAAALAGMLRRVLPSLEAAAPENLDLVDWSNLPMSYGDADWRRVIRALQFSDLTARDWSVAACRSWPALTQRLGGDKSCEDALRAIVLSGEAPGEVNEYWETLARGGTPARETREEFTPPPSKDPDYARYATPLYQECERRRGIDDVTNRQFHACVVNKTRKTSAAVAALHAAVPGLARRWSAFQRILCQAEDDARDTTSSGRGDRAIDRWQCEVRASLHGGFVTASFAHDDTDAFVRHMTHREAWGKEVMKGIAMLPKFASSPVCGNDDKVWPCREPWARQASLRRGAQSARALERQIDDFASATCATWSSLRARLGAACQSRVANHLASSGLVLGGVSVSP
jgi:hypothetical protein